MGVMVVTEAKQITIIVYNINQESNTVQSHHICITRCRDNFVYERDMSVDDNE